MPTAYLQRMKQQNQGIFIESHSTVHGKLDSHDEVAVVGKASVAEARLARTQSGDRDHRVHCSISFPLVVSAILSRPWI